MEKANSRQIRKTESKIKMTAVRSKVAAMNINRSFKLIY